MQMQPVYVDADAIICVVSYQWPQ